MKQITLLLLLAPLLLVQHLFAQSTVVIQGRITKPVSDEVMLSVSPLLLVPQEQETEAALQDNKFRLEISVTGPTMAELVHGNEMVPVYLEPGFDLTVSLNGEKFYKSMKFEGKGANENNYLVQYTRRFDEVEEYQVLPDNIKLLETEFLANMDYRKDNQLKHLEKYTSKNPVSDAFKAYALNEINFSYANDRLTYFDLREQVVIGDNRLKPSAAYFDFLSELDMKQPSNLLSPTFGNFIGSYIKYFTGTTGITEASNEYYLAMYHMARQKLSGEALTMAQVQILKQSIQKGHVSYTRQMLQQFTGMNDLPETEAYLQNLFDQSKTFALGSPAPDFELTTVDGKKVALSDFKGKLVYLSFWRTDCGLCMIEMPHSQQLMQKLEGKEIVFLNVGMDEDEAKWRELVTSRRLLGVHVYTKGMSTELVKRYGLRDMPAYFLIDEEGGFISIKARRPNDREVLTEILNHLNQKQALAK